MERFYQIAGVKYRILIPDGCDFPDEGVLADFRADATGWDHTLEIRLTDHLPEPEGDPVYADPGKSVYVHGDIQCRYEGAVDLSLDGAWLHTRRQGNYSLVQVLRSSVGQKISPKTILNAMEAEHQIVEHGGFLLHASWIRWRDRAILFTAPSGTGKSTQADLWCRLRGAELINGDRAAVFAQESGLPQVRGIPFSGSSRVGRNAAMPLAAIVYLSQAPVTAIAPLTGFRAFRSIWEGCSVNIWNREDVQHCSQTVMDVLGQVPVYHLACTPDESAVNALQRELENWR